MARASSLRMPSWSQRARAPAATAARATSGVCSGRRNTSTMSIGEGTWSREGTIGTPNTSGSGQLGLTPNRR